MVKAAALYIVIIVSLLIAVISASLLTIAFYYRLEVQKKLRMDKLITNMESGTAIILSENYNTYDEEKVLDLYGDQKDSLVLNKSRWGVFDLQMLKSFELKDTLKRAFLSGNEFKDQGAIYLADEDRPLSVSGKTQIIGNGELPKAGLKQAYVDGRPYEGKELIKGSIKPSGRELPALNDELLKKIATYLEPMEGMPFDIKDSISNSFFNKELVYKLNADQQDIDRVKISGKIILISDTTVKISSSAVLEDVQIYARAIVIESGFKGSCQLFARDSIIIGKECNFLYPSFAGIFKPESSKIQAKVSLDSASNFSGILVGHELQRTDLQTLVSLGKNTLVNGEVYAGYIKVERTASVQGKVYANRFIMQTPSTLYENYLIDITLNRKLLSKYYLSSPIFKGNKSEQKILKWLN
nr:hypothetical protein [Pedobacter panaciterrae]